MLTQKHSKMIAEIIKITREQWPGRMGGKGAPSGCLADRLADYFTKENPRFNRDKFMNTCGF